MRRDASATNHYNSIPSNKPFTPSSWLLEQQIESAIAKFDAARQRLLAEREAAEVERQVRAEVNKAKAIHYRRIQLGY